jgi:hypothetical protein
MPKSVFWMPLPATVAIASANPRPIAVARAARRYTDVQNALDAERPVKF